MHRTISPLLSACVNIFFCVATSRDKIEINSEIGIVTPFMEKSLNSNNKRFRTFRSFDRASEAEAERRKKTWNSCCQSL